MKTIYCAFLQNGNWADRVCNEKHGFICMKMSASEPSGDEVEQNVGCKTVRELYFFQYLKKKNVSLVHTVMVCSLKLSLSVTLQGWVLYP